MSRASPIRSSARRPPMSARAACRLAGEVMRWLFTGKGMLTYSPSIVAASVKVLEESATPDVQCTFAPGSFKNGQIGELEETPGLSAGAWQMRPLSRGYVEAKSNRPGDAPAINPRYLSEESDRRAIIGGLRLARRLFAAPALQRFVREETLPGPQIQTDDELLDYARRNGGTCYHASCTCLMGSHAMSVVDSELRVHGLDGLRVIDASVMPAVTSTNTNAPTIMIHHDRRKRRGDDQSRRAAKTSGVAMGRRAEPSNLRPTRISLTQLLKPKLSLITGRTRCRLHVPYAVPSLLRAAKGRARPDPEGSFASY